MSLTPQVKKSIFDTLRSALEKLSPPMVVTKDSASIFELTGNIPVPYGSRKTIIPGMYFSSAVVRKEMVSFYFFPLYFHENEYEGLIPSMKKCLKGKTCFSFKKPEQINGKELHAMLKKGVSTWKKSGYLK